jgi:hypothetical protein
MTSHCMALLHRFLKVYSKSDGLMRLTLLISITLFALLSVSCQGERLQDTSTGELSGSVSGLDNLPSVYGQTAPPDQVKSIQLYREDDRGSIPAIVLGSDEFITLKFDELGRSPRMFRVRVRHRNADWTPGPLMTDFYLRGYREDLITGGRPSNVQNPYYTHYTYRFPNENMQVIMSGNYLLEVLEYESSRVLFPCLSWFMKTAGG